MKDFITSYIKATEVTESCGDFLSMDLFQPQREVKNMELYRKAGFDEYMAYRGAVYKRNRRNEWRCPPASGKYFSVVVEGLGECWWEETAINALVVLEKGILRRDTRNHKAGSVF